MLRVIRIIAIMVFALLIGVSANALRAMHDSGELMEQYNSRRKANITLFSFSVVAVAALGWFELRRVGQMSRPRGYGSRRRAERKNERIEGRDSTSIYSAPKTLDDWTTARERRPRKARHQAVKERSGAWLRFAQLCAVVIPMGYAAMLTLLLRGYDPSNEIAWLLPSALGALLLLALVVAYGILRLKTWGLTLGYVLAMCNLMVFPYGTALGLFLLIGLVGASSEFVLASREKKKSDRRKGRKGLSVAATI